MTEERGVLSVPVTINFGDLPYFDGELVLSCNGTSGTVRQVAFHKDHVVEKFPLLYCQGRPVDALEMNLFMEHRYRGRFLPPKKGGRRNPLGGVTVETIQSIANSLRLFLSWLAETDTDWREVYAAADSVQAKAWLPPYRYRMHLINRIQQGEIERDTANLYINHVRQFYEWARAMQRIERLPFEYKQVPIKKQRKDGDFDLLFTEVMDEKVLMIQSSDLAIPKKYKNKLAALTDRLAPFSAEELGQFFGSHYLRLDIRRLASNLAVASGLRAGEVVTLTENVIEDPDVSAKPFFIVSITGKFNKERKILVPRFLMKMLWQYKNSPEHLHRAGKWDLRQGTGKARPLFLNRSGGKITSASLTNITSCVAAELAVTGIKFERSFHDLRATYATNLARFMLERNMPLGFIQYKLMSLMGHANFATTLKYINFARSVTFESQMQDWVAKVFSEFQPALLAEAASSEMRHE